MKRKVLQSSARPSLFRHMVEDTLAQKPIRLWSLIISLFGDSVVPYGGEIWLGTIINIFAQMNIEEGAVRTAMSRLTSDGWLVRKRVGRKSYYSLDDKGQNAFMAASRRIYAPDLPERVTGWQFILATGGRSFEEPVRRKLRHEGFGMLAANLFVRPVFSETPPQPELSAHTDFSIFMAKVRDEEARNFTAKAWHFSALGKAFAQFNVKYRILQQELIDNGADSHLMAMECVILRMLLIHDFRKLILRLPPLPKDFMGSGNETAHFLTAFRLVENIYPKLSVKTDGLLQEIIVDHQGRYHSPDAAYFARLGGRLFEPG